MTDSAPLNMRYFIIGALALLLGSLTFSVYMMSVSQFLLAGAWLLDGLELRKLQSKGAAPSMLIKIWLTTAGFMCALYRNFISKWGLFFKNKYALIFSSIFLMHILGVIYSTDLNYALKDLRTKLPIILLPLFLGTIKPITRNEFNILLFIYLAAVIANTFISTWLLFISANVDSQSVSFFISHIRFSLNIALSIFLLIYLGYTDNLLLNPVRILFALSAVWLILFLFILKSLSGIMALTIAGFIIGLYFATKIKSLAFKLAVIFILLIVPSYLAFYTRSTIKSFTQPWPMLFDTLATHTALGNPYLHDTATMRVEHGRYVGLYLNWDELQQAWNKRSEIDFMGRDQKNNEIRYTLVRYLNSKYLRKDAAGVSLLGEDDIRHVEQGIADVLYLDRLGIKPKIHIAILGLQSVIKHGNPNDNTFMQRIEHWKASFWIIKKNPVIGVGTGDMNVAFRQAYIEMNSPLEEHNRWRSHNQFLSIFVGFGIVGLIWFLLALFYPACKLKGQKNFMFSVFFLIALLSMLVEDTIETQAGVTFFALFYCLFLFHPYRQNINPV